MAPPFSEPNLLVRACNQLGQFLQHRETNLRYLALESMCTLASSEFSHEAVKTHIETVINALKVGLRGSMLHFRLENISIYKGCFFEAQQILHHGVGVCVVFESYRECANR